MGVVTIMDEGEVRATVGVHCEAAATTMGWLVSGANLCGVVEVLVEAVEPRFFCLNSSCHCRNNCCCCSAMWYGVSESLPAAAWFLTMLGGPLYSWNLMILVLDAGFCLGFFGRILPTAPELPPLLPEGLPLKAEVDGAMLVVAVATSVNV
jgi:hypothetical protein